MWYSFFILWTSRFYVDVTNAAFFISWGPVATPGTNAVFPRLAPDYLHVHGPQIKGTAFVMPSYRNGGDNEVGIPYWLCFLLTAIPTAWLWHRDRRRVRPGCCLRCGYDLTGNLSGVCPECGEKTAIANSEGRIAN